MIGSAYIMVVLGILLAKGIGFYRDMLFAGVFGTSVESDIYFQVFGLVNLIFTGIGVALSTLVIKNLNKAENIGNEKSYAASFIRKSTLALTAVAVVLAFLAKPIVKLILPELAGADLELAIKMMYIMLPSLVFVVIAYIVSGLLQNKRVYFITSIMSLPFNVAIIISLFTKNVSVFTVGIVTTIGWFLHIAIQLPAFFKNGYSFTAPAVKKTAADKKFASPEIIWIFISNMMFQLCVYIDRAFVSSAEGMASTFNYASNLFITIASVFVVAMSTVVFPSVSKNYEEGNTDYVRQLVSYIVTIMSAIFLPFLLVVACFGKDVIRLVYERGAFTAESTAMVSVMMLLYTLGALGYVSQELFNKVLYLAGKYKYTVIGTVCVILLNVIANIAINSVVPADAMVAGAIPLTAVLIGASTAVLLTAYAVLIAIGIKQVIGNYLDRSTVADIVRIFLSGVGAFIVYILFNTFACDFAHGYITFIVPLCACGIAYIAGLALTGVLKKLIKREKKG